MQAIADLSEGVNVEWIGPHVVVLVDEVPILLSLSLESLLPPVNVGRKIAL